MGTLNLAIQASSLLQQTEAAATSWLAWRIYVVLTAAALLSGSLWFAYSRRTAIVSLRPFRGRPPTRAEGIRRRIAALNRLKRHMIRTMALNLISVALFGLIVPAAVLGLGLYAYGWFFPGNVALVATLGGHGVSPSPQEIAWFVISQWSMGMSGVAGDAVARSGALGSVFVPGDMIIALAIGAFRYFIALFGGIFLHLLYSAVRAADRAAIDAQVKDLVVKLQYAH